MFFLHQLLLGNMTIAVVLVAPGLVVAVKPGGDGKLVLEGEVYAFSLRSVTECGVVDFDVCHEMPIQSLRLRL